MTTVPAWIAEAGRAWAEYIAEVADANRNTGESSATRASLQTPNREVLAAARAGALTDSQLADLEQTITAQAFAPLLQDIDHWIAEHGAGEIPQKTTIERPDGTTFKLGRAVNSLRERYAAGRIDVGRIIVLEQRPEWVWSQWDARLRALREYVDDVGSLEGLYPANPVLYRWLQRQRQRSEELSPEQLAQLEAIPGAFAQPGAPQFVAEMKAWAAAHPDRDINTIPTTASGDTDPDEARLGKRASYYRSRYRIGKLADDAIEVISQIPGWKWPR